MIDDQDELPGDDGRCTAVDGAGCRRAGDPLTGWRGHGMERHAATRKTRSRRLRHKPRYSSRARTALHSAWRRRSRQATRCRANSTWSTDKLKLTEDQLAVARTQVKQTRADYTKKLTAVETTLATKASADDVKALGTDVNGVKTDLDATKGNLQQLRGEHGELIARNHEELEQLKRRASAIISSSRYGQGTERARGLDANRIARAQARRNTSTPWRYMSTTCAWKRRTSPSTSPFTSSRADRVHRSNWWSTRSAQRKSRAI